MNPLRKCIELGKLAASQTLRAGTDAEKEKANSKLQANKSNRQPPWRYGQSRKPM